MSAQYRSEFSKPTVGGSSCEYNTLGNYYGGGGTMAAPLASTLSGVFVTPDYSAPGYNTLLHDQSVPSCGGYFNIQSAYGAGADCCNTSFTTRMCSGTKPPVDSARRARARAAATSSCASCPNC